MILLDACVPRRYRQLIGSWGFPATLSTDYVSGEASDAEVMELATQLRAPLVTVDLDFSNIIDYPPQQYFGIIVMRYHVSEQIAVDQSLQQALQDLYPNGLVGALVIIAPGRYRVRR